MVVVSCEPTAMLLLAVLEAPCAGADVVPGLQRLDACAHMLLWFVLCMLVLFNRVVTIWLIDGLCLCLVVRVVQHVCIHAGGISETCSGHWSLLRHLHRA